MKRYIISGGQFRDRERAYNYLIDLFDLPDYIGHNLDALWDVLLDRPGMDIEIDDARLLPFYLGQYGLDFLNLFGDLQAKEGFNVEIFW